MPTSFLLTWFPPPVEATNGPITAYILEYGESGASAPPPHIISLSGEVEEHTVTGLKPHTKHYVKVAAETAAGRGPFSEPVLAKTALGSECLVLSWHCTFSIVPENLSCSSELLECALWMLIVMNTACHFKCFVVQGIIAKENCKTCHHVLSVPAPN